MYFYGSINHISQFRVRGQIEPLMLAFPLNRAEERLEVGGWRHKERPGRLSKSSFQASQDDM